MTGCGDAASSAVTTGPALDPSPAVSVTAGSATTSPSPADSTATSSSTTAEPVTTTVPDTVPPVSTVPPLFEFVTAGSGDGWNVVNDTVMGGVSSGQLALEESVLVFTGELSLDNNGGFASVRSPFIDPRAAADWATRLGPRIVVEGDGRTWTVEVRSDDRDGGWISSLTTSGDSLTDVTLPWSSFEPVTRFLDPREADVPLDPAGIASIAFYLVDGVEGSFRLGIRSIS
jgi:hypothetical protein